MISEYELLTFLFGVSTLVFVSLNIRRLRTFPQAGLFLAAFVMVLPGWVATMFEHLFWGELFNAIEHVSYAGAMTLFALWTWQVTFSEGPSRS